MQTNQPRATRPGLPVLLLGAALLAGGCSPGGPSIPALEPTGPEKVDGPLSLTPILFGTTRSAPQLTSVEAELGQLQVPERHARPDGRQIQVRFVRFPATGPAGGSSHPIVYLAGGPGGSGTHTASGDRFPLFQRLREVADVIAYDQRGTWGTEPYMICPGSWSYPLDKPASLTILRTSVEPFLEECADHWGSQADPAAYNSVESAEDLESLRKALGAEKLTLWGISYGTHLGLAYIRAHPERVHRAILAGVEGPHHTYKLPARIETVVQRIGAAIEADPRASRAAPDFMNSLRSLAEKLDREPVPVRIEDPETGEALTVVVGGQDLRDGVFAVLGERAHMEAELLTQGLPILEGDLRILAQFALSKRRENQELVMSLSMDCASGASAARRALILEQSKTTLLGDSNLWLEAACPSWPVEDLGNAFRAPVHSEVPALFISGSLDIKTPPENAEEILSGFPFGRHLIIEGGCHDDDLFLSSPEIIEAMMTFLRGGDPPRRIQLAPLRFEVP